MNVISELLIIYIKNKVMKKVYILFLLFIILSNFKINAQPWAEKGATWYYDFWDWGLVGYLKIYKTGDTLVNGKECDVLKKYEYYYDHMDSTYKSIFLLNEYTYTENNIVYYYRDSLFHTLYDFNAKPGDSWIYYSNNYGDSAFTKSKIVVDSIGKSIINGDTLKYLWTSSKDCWRFSGMIIEKIGCLGYMFPNIYYCIMDAWGGGPIRCYTDSTNWFYKNTRDEQCEYTVNVTENKGKERIKIYPDPADNYINIRIDNRNKLQYNAEIYDIPGKLIYSEKINSFSNIAKINVINISDGIYILKLKSEEGIFTKKIIINH
jgi:hypothetical protein